MFIDKVGLITELTLASKYLIELISNFNQDDVESVKKLMQQALVIKWKQIRIKQKLYREFDEELVNAALFEYGWQNYRKRILIEKFGENLGELYHQISSDFRDMQHKLKHNPVVELILEILNHYHRQGKYIVGFDCINEYFGDDVQYIGNEVIQIFGAYYKFDKDFRFDDDVVEVDNVSFRIKETLKIRETVLVEINGNKTITTTEIQKGVNL